MNESEKNIKTTVIQAEEDTSTKFEAHPSGVIFEIKANGKIAYISSGLEYITGFKSSEVLNISLNLFLEKFLGKQAVKQLLPLVNEVVIGKRKYLESNVKAIHPVTEEEKLYSLQIESSSNDLKRTVLFIHAHNQESQQSERLEEAQLRSMRILEKGNLIFLRSNDRLQITEILGDTEKILGIPSAELEDNPTGWLDVLLPEHYRSMNLALARVLKQPRRFTKELCFQHRKTKAHRWLLFSAVPVFEGSSVGSWEGFALDITERKNVELSLKRQTKRYNSLYQVVSNIQKSEGPTHIALNALSALIEATTSSAGAVWYSAVAEQEHELTAIKNFPVEIVEYLGTYYAKKNNIVHLVCSSFSSIILPNLEKEAVAYELDILSKRYKSLLIVPLSFRTGEVSQMLTGALMLVSDKSDHYQTDDVELVTAAAGQIALNSQRAEYLAAEKREATSLALLYKVSKQMTKAMTAEEVAENSFPLLEKEFPLKRVWLGVLNEGGSHLSGVYGSGSGMNSKINRMQISIRDRDDAVGQAIQEQKVTSFSVDDSFSCKGLDRIFEYLNTKTVFVVPMISIGQVIGVILLEPEDRSIQAFSSRIPFFTSIANEMATAIFSRKLEAQMAQADKMRMAGLLVSGFAHNFNNLLQAVIGQASLIEAQMDQDSKVKITARSIIESASKGAELIKKMAFFSESSMSNATVFDLSKLLRESNTTFQQIVGEKIQLFIQIEAGNPKIFGDYFRIQQTISNLLLNAREAVERKDFLRGKGAITLKAFMRNVEAGEINTEIASGSYFQIDVVDNGVGMDHDQVERCFEPFFTTKDFDENTGVGYAGSGLSLANAYNVIEQHGGTMTASSKLGQGSTFSVYLPLYKKKTAGDTEAIVPERETVIAISSDFKFLPEVEHIFSELNMDLLKLEKRSEMLAYMANKGFRPKLLMFDLDSVSVDIIDFFKLLKERYSLLKFICFVSDVKAWEGLLQFLEDVLIVKKPVSLTVMHKNLKKLLSGDKAVSLIEKLELERARKK